MGRSGTSLVIGFAVMMLGNLFLALALLSFLGIVSSADMGLSGAEAGIFMAMIGYLIMLADSYDHGRATPAARLPLVGPLAG